MVDVNEYSDENFTSDERKMFEEKFCKGTFKPRRLTQEEIEQLKKENRV